MKKILLIISAILILSCSKSDDTSINPPHSDTNNELNVPDWLIGLYKADNLNNHFPYPKSHPYNMNFSANDILIKGVSNSEIKSMKTFIDSLKTIYKLISINEVYNTVSTSYKLTVEYKNIESLSAFPDRFTYTIDPVEGVSGKINIEYYYVAKGSEYDYGTVRYTKQ